MISSPRSMGSSFSFSVVFDAVVVVFLLKKSMNNIEEKKTMEKLSNQALNNAYFLLNQFIL